MRSARIRAAPPWRRPAGPPARRDASRSAILRRRQRQRTGSPGGIRGPWSASPLGTGLCCALDGLLNARIGAAAANIARQCFVDIAVGRRRNLLQKGGGGHDLPGLTVAALDDLEVEPGPLDLLADRRRADGLDGGDARGFEWPNAGPAFQCDRRNRERVLDSQLHTPR